MTRADARVFWSEYCLPKELVPSREFVTYLADHLECGEHTSAA